MSIYKLDKDEKNELNNTWKFLNYFHGPLLNNGKYMYGTRATYRINLIKKIKKKYTYDEFYKYEKILNKLFWKLKKKIEPFIKNKNTIYKKISNDTLELEISKNKNFCLIGSITNSYIQYNENNKMWYYLKETSELDDICMNIMRNKKEYEKFHNNPEEIKKYSYKTLDLYSHMNYPFPNINPMFYNENKKQYWIKKIKKMYYTKRVITKDTPPFFSDWMSLPHPYYCYDCNWYELIKP